MPPRAGRDPNFVTTLLAVDIAKVDTTTQTPVTIGADPTTHRLLVDASISSGGLSASKYAVIIDDYTTPGVSYIGKAVPGTATTSALWQILKMDENTGLRLTWADGNSNFDNVWGATFNAGTVAGLTYS